MHKNSKTELLALLTIAGMLTAGSAQAANTDQAQTKRSNGFKLIDQSRTTISDGRDGSCAPGKCGDMEEPAKKAQEKKPTPAPVAPKTAPKSGKEAKSEKSEKKK